MLRKYSYSFWIFPMSLIGQYDLNEYVVNNLPLPVDLASSKRILKVSISTAKYEVAREKVSRLCVQMSKVLDTSYTFMSLSKTEKQYKESILSDNDDLPF